MPNDQAKADLCRHLARTLAEHGTEKGMPILLLTEVLVNLACSCAAAHSAAVELAGRAAPEDILDFSRSIADALRHGIIDAHLRCMKELGPDLTAEEKVENIIQALGGEPKRGDTG